MAKLFDIMGNFPFKPEDKKPMLIRKQDYSCLLYTSGKVGGPAVNPISFNTSMTSLASWD